MSQAPKNAVPTQKKQNPRRRRNRNRKPKTSEKAPRSSQGPNQQQSQRRPPGFRSNGGKPAADLRARAQLASLPRVAEGIAMAIAVPEIAQPFRWPESLNVEETAVAKPWDVTDVGYANDTTAPGAIRRDQTVGVMFRDPLRATILYDHNDEELNARYIAYGVDRYSGADILEPNTFTDPTPSTIIVMEAAGDSKTPVPIANLHVASNSDWAPHGDVLYCARSEEGDAGARFFWMDEGTDLACNINGVSQASNKFLIIDKWTGARGLQLDYDESDAVTSTETITLGPFKAGYYALSLKQTGAVDAVALQIETNCDKASWRHLSLPYLAGKLGDIDAIRMMGVTLRLANRTSEQHNSGTMIAYQSHREKSWMNLLAGGTQMDVYSIIASKRGVFNTVAKNGIYAPLYPNSDTDFAMKDHWVAKGGVLLDSYYPLENDNSFVVVVAKIDDAQGRDGFWERRYIVEFLTSDPWVETGVPRISPVAFTQAMAFLKKTRQFHENSLHIGEIWNSIKSLAGKAVAGIRKYGPYVMDAAELAAPLL